jgi:predicted nucleotidyltransferase
MNMNLQGEAKEMVKKEIVDLLSEFTEVQRVVIFGSFVNSDDPHDLDIAVFQDSDEGYYPLAMKYRRALRTIANKIPLDVIPIRRSPEQGPVIEEIQKGEVLYERKDK